MLLLVDGNGFNEPRRSHVCAFDDALPEPGLLPVRLLACCQDWYMSYYVIRIRPGAANAPSTASRAKKKLACSSSMHLLGPPFGPLRASGTKLACLKKPFGIRHRLRFYVMPLERQSVA